jgi:hypothetical protein
MNSQQLQQCFLVLIIVMVLQIEYHILHRPAVGPRGVCFTQFHNSNSECLIDKWSLSHIEHGLVFYLLFGPNHWLLAIILEGVWEVIENHPYMIGVYNKANIAYRGDTCINSMSDMIMAYLGWQLCYNIHFLRHSKLHVLFLFILLEIIGWCWICDCLLYQLYIVLRC